MSSNFTIENVGPETREWEWPKGSGKVNVSYTVKVAEHDKPLEHSRQKGKPAPEVGETVFGYIEASKNDHYPDKLKKVSQGGGGGGFKPRDPAEIKAIQRQHSQEMAIRTLSLAFYGGVFAPESATDLLNKVQSTADWFDKDIANGKAGE